MKIQYCAVCLMVIATALLLGSFQQPSLSDEYGRKIAGDIIGHETVPLLVQNDKPPWWTGWWFRLIVLGAVAGLFFAFLNYQYRQQQLLLENQRLRTEKDLAFRLEHDRIAAEIHDDLGSGLTTIRLLSLLAREMEDDPVKAARLDKIARSASEVMEKMADIVWVMNSRNDTLENLAHHLRRCAGDYLDSHGIQFQIEIPDQLPALPLSGEHRKNVLLAMKECLHNVVKHAGATEVCICISINGQLEIMVKDNGKGIPSEYVSAFYVGCNALAGNGLYNLRQRMKSLGGSVEIENRCGTRVVLRTGISLKQVANCP